MLQYTTMRRIAAVLAAVGLLAGLTNAATTVDSTVLVIARDEYDASKATSGLSGYGIPWQKALIPKDGTSLPELNSSLTQGYFGGFIVLGSLAYDYDGIFRSALTQQQWDQLFAYQSAFHVRMVRLEEYPGPGFGASPVDTNNPGCCGSSLDQPVKLTSTAAFSGANVKVNAPISTKGLWHYPAVITAPETTTAFAKFEPSDRFTEESVAAVINNFGTREQLVWFLSWATAWSATSNFLQHAHIHWLTRSLFIGKRKIHLNAQVDDIHLDTELYQPVGGVFRLRTGDLDAHIAWQQSLNSRLPAGSNFFLELAHNGNGNIISSFQNPKSEQVCHPGEAVGYDMPPRTALDFMKPLGTGVDRWPTMFEVYEWSQVCARLDPLASWFLTPTNLNAFAHVSHTFAHLELNNATYHDAFREVLFNQAWMQQLGMDQATRFSAKGLISPGITGLRNGDAIKAWTDRGINHVAGDNTQASLRNPESSYWPLATTVQANGGEGIWIIPRYSTTIYYNCDKPGCTLQG